MNKEVRDATKKERQVCAGARDGERAVSAVSGPYLSEPAVVTTYKSFLIESAGLAKMAWSPFSTIGR
jgi:hypothetical protein